MIDTFQKGSLVLSIGSTFGELGSRGADARRIHWFMCW
jgi:hypothetical protein